MRRNYRNTSRLFGVLALIICSTIPIIAGAQTLSLNNQSYQTATLSNTAVTMTGQSELHITGAADPMPGSTIDLQSEDSWVFFHDVTVRPSYVASTLLSRVTVNGSPAVLDSNVKVVEYGMGAVVIPYPAGFQPMQVFDGENFSGTSSNLSPNTAYGGVLSGGINSFTLKRGYTATIANGNYSVNYVAADGDLKIGALPSQLAGQVNFIRIFPWRWTSKKGIGGDPGIGLLNVDWWYDWNIDQSSSPDLAYVPIRWGRYWPGLGQNWGSIGANSLLGYNEPDSASQSNILVGDAIWSWPDLLGTGLRVGSPACTDGGVGSWLIPFIQQADASNLRVDFVAQHYYQAHDPSDAAGCASQMYNFLLNIWNNTHKPIWITEWNNGANWTDNNPWPVPTYAQQQADVAAMVQMLDSTPFVEHYALYNWVEDPRSVTTNGVLTAAGVVYRDEQSPIGYQQILPGHGMEPSAQYDFEGNLDDSSGSGNNALSKNYPDLIAGHNGGTALQFNGTDDEAILPDSLCDSTDFTFAAWIYWNGGAAWQRIFDFGIRDSNGASSGKYMFLTPSSGSGNVRFAISTAGYNNEQALTTGALTPNTWTHVAVTISGNTGILYINGTQVAVNNAMTINPSDLAAIHLCLGRSSYTADPYFSGKLDDVIIRNQALSATQIAALAAGDQPPQAVSGSVSGGTFTPGMGYSGSVAGDATDPDVGDIITYSKVYGPSWLSVAADGMLSGTPDSLQDGIFTIRATDTSGKMCYFTLSIAAGSYTSTPIALTNGDFEAGVANIGGFDTTNDVPGWTDISIVDSGVEGSNAWWGTYNNGYSAFMKPGDSAYDMSGYTIQDGDMFTVGFVGKSWDGSGQWTATMFYDNPTNVIGTCVQSVDGTWTTYSGTTTISATAASVGHLLGVIFKSTGSGYANIDNATVYLISSGGGAPDTTPPAAPTGLSATAGVGSVSLNWADNTEPDLASYTVYRSTTSGSGYVAIASGLTVSAYTDSSAVNGTTYYYVVTATDTSSNESGNSQEVSATPQQNPPTTPTFLNASVVSDTQIDLSWGGSTGATSYNVKRSATSGGPYTTIASGVTTTSYSDTGLTASTTYYYVVSAVNSAGESSDSVEVSATTMATPDTTPPAAPTGLSATAGDGSMSLNWADNTEPDLASYTVYRSTTSGSGYVTIASGLTVSAYTDNTVANGTTYYYVVTATDTSSNESLTSAEVSATPQMTAPATPTGLGATATSDTQISLNWTASAGATSYNVKRASTTGGPYTTIATGVATTSYSDTGLTASTAYYYVVSAVNAGGESANSAEASATTQVAAATLMHVNAITVTTVSAGRGQKTGQATVTILDGTGSPIAGATVSGTFTGSYNESDSGVTDASGTAVINTAASAKGGVSFTFTVDNVTKASHTYDSAANVVNSATF